MSLPSEFYVRYLAAPEGTYGVDAVDALLAVTTNDIVYQDIRSAGTVQAENLIVDLPRARGSASGSRHGVIPTHTNVSLEIPFAGSDITSRRPYYSPFLQASGLAEAIETNDTTYRFSTGQTPSMTLGLYRHDLMDLDKARLALALGVRGNSNLQFTLGEEAYFSFEGQGLYREQTANLSFFDEGKLALRNDGSTAVGARTGGAVEKYADQEPLMAVQMVISWDVGAGSESLILSSMNLDFGWNTSPIEAISASAGQVSSMVNTRDLTSRANGSFSLADGGDRLDELIDAYGSGAELSMSAVIENSTTKVTLTAGNVQLGQPTENPSNGYMQHDVPFFLNADWSDVAADNELEIKFEAS
jgi:hypothetical protein